MCIRDRFNGTPAILDRHGNIASMCVYKLHICYIDKRKLYVEPILSSTAALCSHKRSSRV